MDGGDAPSRAEPGEPKPAGVTTRDSGTQTESKVQGEQLHLIRPSSPLLSYLQLVLMCNTIK